MSGNDTNSSDTDRLGDEDRCEKCGVIPEFDETTTNPLDGVVEDRYECECGHMTVIQT